MQLVAFGGYRLEIYFLLLLQKREKEIEEQKEREKGKPGFNSRWYTDSNAHIATDNGHKTEDTDEEDKK